MAFNLAFKGLNQFCHLKSLKTKIHVLQGKSSNKEQSISIKRTSMTF